jgi:hypothetical protein
MSDSLKKFFVTNPNREGRTTNARYAMNAKDAAISESKLYESDDLTLEVREAGSESVQKFRVRCGMTVDAQEIAEPVAV